MRGRVRTIRPLFEPRKYLATGTPVSESPNNAFNVLSVLAPERLTSRARFDQHFVIRVPTSAGGISQNKATGYSNLEELKRMLEATSVRRLKADVRGMPDKTEDQRECQPLPEQADHYSEIMKGIMADIEGDPDWARNIDIACVKLLRARQVLNHPGLLDLSGDSGKYRALDDIVEEVLSNPEAKILIWTEWNRAIDLLAARYRHYGCITIDRRTPQEALKRYEVEFDYSGDRVVIATPAKGGTGLDWLARARTAVYVERTYSLVNHRQSFDRVVRRVGEDDERDSPTFRRIKQIKRSPATILYLHVPKSVDDAIFWVLRRKLDLGEALLTRDERLIAEGKDHLIRMLRASARLAA